METEQCEEPDDWASENTETDHSSVSSENLSPHKHYHPVDSDYRIMQKNMKHALESSSYFPKHICHLMDSILAWQPLQGIHLAILQYETTKYLDYMHTTSSEDSLESFLEVIQVLPLFLNKICFI